MPGPPLSPPTLLYLYVLLGRDGVVTSFPSRTPDFAAVSVLHVKANSPRGFQPESPATNSLSSHHHFFCDRNTASRPIQIEEKSLRMNAFIVHWKDRYLRPRFILVSVAMPIADPNGVVPSLSLDYLRASRHELRYIRVPLLFLVLLFFLIHTFPVKLRVCMCQV